MKKSVKAHSLIRQGELEKDEEHFRKALHLFENALSSFQSIIFANCEKFFFNFNP